MDLIKRSFMTAGFLVLLGILAQGAYAKDGHGNSRGHDDRHYRSHHDEYYRQNRYYPREYYHYRKIYFQPSRKYYYYYDLYPEKVCYYNCEKDIRGTNPEYLSVTSIANMASQGVPDSAIIYEIERTNSKYKLDLDTINYLRQHDVSSVVIDYMLNSSK